MALVPYTLQALARSDSEGTGGSNIVVGAVITCTDINGVPVTMFDDALSSNPSTAKTTDSNGQRIVWVPKGIYTFTTNGISKKVDLGEDSVAPWSSIIDYPVGTLVVRSGVIYSSLTTPNAGNDPQLSSTNWIVISSPIDTAVKLVSSSIDFAVGTIIDVNGYSSYNDGGVARWQKTSSTGTPSQEPKDTGDGTIVDSNGSVWSVIKTGYVDVRVFGVGVSGDQTLELQSAFDSGAKLDLSGLSSITIRGGVVIRDDTTLISGKCRILVDYSETGVSQAVLLGDGVTADKLRVRLLSGRTFRRLVVIKSDCKIGKIVVDSIDQIANDASKNDAGLQLDGSRLDCDLVLVSNFDYSVIMSGNEENTVRKIICKSYVRGVLLDTVTKSDFPSIRCIGAAPNAAPEAGHNGLLIENCTLLSFTTIYVENSGEHAVRIGGDVSDFSGDIDFGTIYAYKPGQCGFKISTDGTNGCQRVSVGTITAVDCADTNLTGSNEDTCRLESCFDVSIGQINGYKRDKTNCANDGLFLSGCEKIIVGSMAVSNPKRSMVHIDDYKGKVRDVTVGNFHLNECAGTAIVINHPTEILEHMRFGPGYMRDNTPNEAVVEITTNSPPASGVFHPLIFDFDVEITGWTSPGSVTKDDLISTNSTTAKIYNDMRPRQ